MMGVCIPLSAVTNSGAELPVAVIAAAAFSTAAVWAGEVVGMVLNTGRSRNTVDTESKQQVAALNGRIQELEERLSNVETIDRFEQHLAQKSIAAGHGTVIGHGTPVAPIESTTYSAGYGSEAAYQAAKHD
jgi:hypothetical protein